jgi:predicted ATP-grasp superfamily ATP-dependent carboligase
MFPEMAKVEIDVDDLESSAALIANNVEEATEEATE